jgi:hypothetical protein
MATPTGSTKSREKALKSSRKSSSTRQKDAMAEAHASATQQPPAGVQPIEPEDPYLVGAGAERQRQLLARNAKVQGKGRKPEAQPELDTPAGLHATGTNVDLNHKK